MKPQEDANRSLAPSRPGQKKRRERVRLNEHVNRKKASSWNSPAPTSVVFLTTAQAAEYLNISAKTLHNWRVTGREGLRFYRFGRAVRYSRADLDAFAGKQCYTSTSAAEICNGAELRDA
ncbi:transcriptional regulator protein [Rhizobium phaseoli]|uniref:helix-turn-helix domain-containing protein n=1 Tax=Rhizobium phaseoli TaxID=396 RepID=UPI0007F11833|nr:helix-turn-helix domain-containing protein [Rhizobium phaseoli]ANL28592.1 transcriptional regulator protein [Rhizobium phaseoli]